MAKRRYSSEPSEGTQTETPSHKRRTEGSEKGGIESRKREIAIGISETRERGERILKEMAESALKKK